MSEKTFDLHLIDHSGFYGIKDSNIELIRKLFPKLKIIVRGDMVKVIGEDEEIEIFYQRFQLLLDLFDKQGKIENNEIVNLMLYDQDEQSSNNLNGDNDLILYGRNGIPIKARTPNQKRMYSAIYKYDMMFCIGPAGTGKTYTAIALAVRFLKDKKIKKIILTRPAVEAGENLGFLPGDLKEKLDPYMQPLYDALNDMLPAAKLNSYFEDGTIEIAPLAFMRGRTLENAFVILDEAQNATLGQMKMFLTRMGENSKFIITGDITQIDLPPHQASGLLQTCKMLRNIDDINFIFLNESDVMRHPLVSKIIKKFEENQRD
ncbi:MAG: PhoH family protein [Bacteroidales bacterium]|jgi:phosphate starvation-inducible PhoH-like protein|nr:PhoH family protein [Bacteroidales bacterium]